MTQDTTFKSKIQVRGYDDLVEMLDKHMQGKNKLANSQEVTTSFALYIASHGISVFRCHVPLFNDQGVCVACSCEDFRTSIKCKDKYPHQYLKPGERCEDQGKCPMFGGINDSTTDEAEIRDMFKPTRVKNIVTGKSVVIVPNIGIDTGASNLLGYDDDAYKKANGSTLEDDFDPSEIDTVRVLSGSHKGTHLWFDRENKPYKSKTRSKDAKIADGTDIRGVNNYLLGPCSLHKSGNRYEFMDGQALGQVPLLPIPKKIDDILAAAYSADNKNAKNLKSGDPDPEAVRRSKLLIDGILLDNSIEHTEWEEYPFSDGQGWRLKLTYCPFNDEDDPHTDHNVAYLAVHQDGCINAFCPHNRCQKQIESFGSGWQLFRKIFAKPSVAQGVKMTKVVNQDTGEITEILAEPIGLDQVLKSIDAIKNDATLTPEARRSRLVGIADSIGSIDKAERVEVSAAIASANAGFSHTRAESFVKECASDAKKRRKTAQRAVAQAKVQAKKSGTTLGRPLIEVGDRQLRDIVDDAITVINKFNAENESTPATYVNAARIVRVVRDENDVVGIAPYGKPGFKLLLSRLADFGHIKVDDETGEEKIIADFPPDDLVTGFLDMGEWPTCPSLDGIVNAPTFSRDGTLQTGGGYSPSTRLFNAGSVKLGDTTPTDDNISKAKTLIADDLLGDFPFKDDASKAHATAYTLLPFVRQLIPGQTPVTLVDSPAAGTGKTKLLVSCAYPALGSEVGLMNECEKEEEWVKTLTSTFLSGASHLVIDNVNNGLSSGKLAAAITAGVWNERILGGNSKPNIRIRTIFAATGNNVGLTDEIARRCVMVNLDANVERPDKRTGFKHNLPVWAKENRDELVTACITMINAWIAKGKPLFSGTPKGSFEEWAGVMGGILQVNGIPGFLMNEDALFDAAVSKTQAIKEFVLAWHDKFGGKPVPSSSLFKLASYSDNNADNMTGEWKNLLADYLGAKAQQSRATKLGNLLAQHKNKVIAGFKLVEDRPANGYKQWALIDPKDASAQKIDTSTRVVLGDPSDPQFGETYHSDTVDASDLGSWVPSGPGSERNPFLIPAHVTYNNHVNGVEEVEVKWEL